MPPMNSLDEYSPWGGNTETISWLQRKACIFVANLKRKYSQRYYNVE